MAFHPAHIPRTQHVDTDPLTYNIRSLGKKGRDGSAGAAKPYVYFRIAPATAKRAGFTKGDPVRVDIDEHARQGRLLRVGSSSRHLSQGGKNGTSQWSMTCVFPHTGDLEKYLPLAAKIRPLTILDTSATEGLIFELPKSLPVSGEAVS